MKRKKKKNINNLGFLSFNAFEHFDQNGLFEKKTGGLLAICNKKSFQKPTHDLFS
jgi:hypothetical protein